MQKIKEQQLLVFLRKTLAQVAIDTTPLNGQKSPLSKKCIDDMKKCFDLISQRERDLKQNNIEQYPIYKDEKEQEIKIYKK
jgi:hypothetical protein